MQDAVRIREPEAAGKPTYCSALPSRSLRSPNDLQRRKWNKSKIRFDLRKLSNNRKRIKPNLIYSEK